MIAFTEVTNLIPEIMKPDTLVLNLSSYIEGYRRWNILPPLNQNESFIVYDDTFDGNYYQYILSTDSVFYEFMTPIMALYQNRDVIILVNRDIEFFEYITESIMRLIQIRYTIIPNNIYEKEDWQYIANYDCRPQGVINLDIDKERFIKLYSNTHQINENDPNVYL